MSYQQIIKDINSGKWANLYLLHGEESFFIDEIDKIIEEKCIDPGLKSFNETIIYGTKELDINTIIDTCNRDQMMSDRQVVLVREAQEVKDIDKLQAYCNKPAQTTILVLAYKYSKLDGRLQLTKTLNKNGVVFLSEAIKDYALSKWIAEFLHSKGLKASPDISVILAEYLGNNLEKINNEVEKLKLNLKPDEPITKGLIEKYIGISKEYSVFELQKSIGERNIRQAQKIAINMGQNIKKNPLILIISSLASYFYKIYRLHGAKLGTETEQLKAIGISSAFILREYKSVLSKYSLVQVENALFLLSEYDQRSKGLFNVSMSEEELLTELVLKLLRA